MITESFTQQAGALKLSLKYVSGLSQWRGRGKTSKVEGVAYAKAKWWKMQTSLGSKRRPVLVEEGVPAGMKGEGLK